MAGDVATAKKAGSGVAQEAAGRAARGSGDSSPLTNADEKDLTAAGDGATPDTAAPVSDSPTRSMPRDLSAVDGSGSAGPAHAGVRRRLGRFASARRRRQPGARAADQDGTQHAPQGRHQADRACLRRGGALPRGPAAQERRPVHHPSAGGGHDPGRARHEPRDGVRRAAARHHRGHALHARGAARGIRRRDRGPGRRRHQAGQRQVRRGRAGRDRPQDGRRDVARHPGPGDQAGRPAAQHAHAAVPAQA